MNQRVYLDWNATAPLRPEARAAMRAAMDLVGNPSSVHAEGRAAKAIVEKARGQVAALVGCESSEVVFISGATEAAALILTGDEQSVCSEIEHDCVFEHVDGWAANWSRENMKVSAQGQVIISDMGAAELAERPSISVCLQAANSETGVIQVAPAPMLDRKRTVCDIAQVSGKVPSERIRVASDFRLVSGHKLGGPKGSGALIVAEWAIDRLSEHPLIPGGGQEQGRRSGTENVIGIAGFGAAAEAARRDLEAGVWKRVAALRNSLEDALAAAAPDLHIFGKDAPRLPNTSCFAVPGWKGETQVMQMDLAGYAISAGSACSSGKVNKASRVLLAMGFDEETASSAIRVSMGPTTTEAEVIGFADTWIEHYRRRRRERAA